MHKHPRFALFSAICLALFGTGLGMPRVAAAPAEAPATYDLIFIEVMPQDVGKTIMLLKNAAKAAREGAGNTGFLILQRYEVPTQFAIVGAWKDNASLRAYEASARTQDFRATLAPFLIAPYDERPHAALLTDPARDNRLFTHPGRQTVVVLTHVDVFAVDRQRGIKLLTALCAESRRQAGNLAFDVLNQSSRANHFSLFQAWKKPPYLTRYLAQNYVFDFRSAELKMTGSLFDQRIFDVIQ